MKLRWWKDASLLPHCAMVVTPSLMEACSVKRRILFACLTPFLVVFALSSALVARASNPVVTAGQAVGQDQLEDVYVVRVYYDTIEDIELLSGYDLFEYNNREEKYVLVAGDRKELQDLEDLGFRVAVDPQETANFTGAGVAGGIGIDTIGGKACYRTVEETYETAQTLAADHPTLAAWIDAGDSWEKATVTNPDLPGYDMMVLRLTNSAIGGDKPRLFVTASIHAREYAPAELLTRFAEYLVNNYNTDADITWILDHHELHLMFQTNPDGRKKAEAGSGVMWRKNTDRDDGCTSTNVTSSYYGTDLNRNFSYQWGTGGSSSEPCSDTYRGPSGGSERETQAVQNYLKEIFPDQRGTGAAPSDATGIYLDLHSHGGYVMWPWGYSSDAPPNNAQLQTLGRKFAYYNGYTPGQITRVLYIASGGGVDYAYGELGVASYAIEVGTAFFEACTSFESTVYPNNLPALIYAAKVARTPYQTPLGPDALSLAVAPASAAAGTTATLTATINDTRYNNTNGTEPTQAIAAAEYYVDTPPWQAGAVAHPMTASDGSFNSTAENVTATVDTTGLAPGRHLLFVRGKDANNNWGAFSAAFLEVTPCVAPETVSGLHITRLDSSRVEVTWAAAAGAVQYEVWSAIDEPYFAPPPGATCNVPWPYTCSITAGAGFEEAALNSPATHTVYLVRAASSCGATSGFGLGRVGEFEYDLQRGD